MNQRHSTETTPKHLAASAEKCNIIEWRILGYSVNIYLSIHLSIYPSIHHIHHILSYPILSYPIYVSMYLCIYVSMYLCIYVCMYASIYLSIYLSMHIMYTIFVPTLHLDSHVLPWWPRWNLGGLSTGLLRRASPPGSCDFQGLLPPPISRRSYRENANRYGNMVINNHDHNHG